MTTLTILPTTAFAKSYADQLRDKGFPESYISKLVSLHNKYPKWDFQPLKTGLNFTAAVKAERSPHSKQLIERQSSVCRLLLQLRLLQEQAPGRLQLVLCLSKRSDALYGSPQLL